MAKEVKAEETVEVAPQPIVSKKETVKKPVKPEWEIKDRTYYILGKNPLTHTIHSKHTSKHPLLYFDAK